MSFKSAPKVRKPARPDSRDSWWIVIIAVFLVLLWLTGCSAVGRPVPVPSDGKVVISVTNPTPDGSGLTDQDNLPPRPEGSEIHHYCAPVAGPDTFIWDAGDPSPAYYPDWVLNDHGSPDDKNEARIWHLNPEYTYTGNFFSVSTTDGTCGTFPMTIEDGSYAGGLSIDAKAWRYAGDVITFVVIVRNAAPPVPAPTTV